MEQLEAMLHAALPPALRDFERLLFPSALFGRGADERTATWIFVRPSLPALITVLYLLIVIVGKHVVEARKREAAAMSGVTGAVAPPRQRSATLTAFVVLHNTFMSLISLYMAVETLLAAHAAFGWSSRFKLFCNPIEGHAGVPAWVTLAPFSLAGLRLAHINHVHYLSRFYEMVDTLIMLCKGNVRQITFLHVFHHATTCWTMYLNIKYGPGGETWWFIFCNSSVHVVMYAHYAAAALGYVSPVKLWITRLQIVQFITYVLQTSFLLSPLCNYQPTIVVLQLFTLSLLYLVLFTQFLVREMRKKDGKVSEKKE